MLAICGRAESIQGRLVQHEGKPPVLETADHKAVALEGDNETLSVLNDTRLANADLEAAGHFTAPGTFVIDPFHTRALRVHKDGKSLAITYWCDVCHIRTYKPGPCWCCQRETDLDLREPGKE